MTEWNMGRRKFESNMIWMEGICKSNCMIDSMSRFWVNSLTWIFVYPVHSKDKNSPTRKGTKRKDGSSEDINTLKESSDINDISVLEETDQIP